MKCSKCGAEIKSTLKFCNKCGAKIVIEDVKEKELNIADTTIQKDLNVRPVEDAKTKVNHKDVSNVIETSNTSDETNSVSETHNTQKQAKSQIKIFGFRSGNIVKKIVSVLYMVFCGLVLFSIVTTERETGISMQDFIINQIDDFMMFLVMISPYIFLSDSSLRDKLPIFKKKKLLSDILGIVLFAIIVIVVSSIIDGAHTDEYKNLVFDNSEKIISGDNKSDYSNESVNELTNYIDGSIENIATKLNIDFVWISDHVYFYGGESDDAMITVYTDYSENIEAIKITDSGKAGYSLVGLKAGTSTKEADNLLCENGFEMLSEGMWADNKCNVVMIESGMIVYEKNSPKVSEDSLKTHAEQAFVPIHSDSQSYAYLGKGQIVELLHNSFSEFSYNFSQLTEYQRKTYGNEINGRYVMLSGEVREVYANGTVAIYCDKFEQESGMWISGTATGTVKIISQQSNLLSALSEGDKITVFARIKPNTYDSMLGTIFFDLYDGIIATLNDQYIDIPLLEDIGADISRYIPENYFVGFGGI